MKPVKVGIVGCGMISDVYLTVAKTFPILEVVACSDLVPDRAKEKAEKHEIPIVCTPEELIADPEIEIVLNLTIPVAHGEIAMAALEAGKAVYNEKPLATTREEAKKMLALANRKDLLVGCAPDTFMGGGLQTCRKLIDDGWIGDPVAASAAFLCAGHEWWYPDPDFFYQKGGGPMFDMGPYYLTALISILGPVKRVSGSTKITQSERTLRVDPRKGEKIPVEVSTHLAGTLDFACGAVGTVVTSFDVWYQYRPFLEIYGTAGSLRLPDPNTFGGEIQLFSSEVRDWKPIPPTHGYLEQHRSIGLADMAHALRTGRQHRANGSMAYHALDVMQAFDDSSKSGTHVNLESDCERPKPLPLGLQAGELDG